MSHFYDDLMVIEIIIESSFAELLSKPDFFAVGQLNKPFSTIVINDDAVAVTFPWE